MTVELERPFVWPEVPEDLAEWNPVENKMASEEQQGMQERMGGASDAMAVTEERRRGMREQAKALLEGRERWRPGVSKGEGFMAGR